MSGAQADKVWDAFCASIPEKDRESVLTTIAEAAQGWCEHKEVMILDSDRMDAINVRAHGIIEHDGKEYTFIVEDGNWNGTVLEDWEGDNEFKPATRTKWVLQPLSHIVSDAVMKGNGGFLIAKWDGLMQRSDIADIPGKYTYDRMVQPGVKIESHYRDKAAKFGFELASEEEAAITRKSLEANNGR